jgi:hypothetical protein
MSYVNNGSARGLARRFLESEGMRIGRVYMMLFEENKGVNFGEERKLSSWTFRITSKCVVDLDIGDGN